VEGIAVSDSDWDAFESGLSAQIGPGVDRIQHRRVYFRRLFPPASITPAECAILERLAASEAPVPVARLDCDRGLLRSLESRRLLTLEVAGNFLPAQGMRAQAGRPPLPATGDPRAPRSTEEEEALPC
jgi:hypothetical protein